MTLQERLNEAESAWHALMTGTMAVSVMKDGRRVEFNRATADQLRAYIEDLKAQLGQSSRRCRPAGVMFT